MSRRKTVAELETELDSANDYIHSLEKKLDNIAGIATEGDQGDALNTQAKKLARGALRTINSPKFPMPKR